MSGPHMYVANSFAYLNIPFFPMYTSTKRPIQIHTGLVLNR